MSGAYSNPATVTGVPHDPMISALGKIVRIDTSALDQADRGAVHRVWSGASADVLDSAAADGGVVVAPGGMLTDRLLAMLSPLVTHAAIAARRGEMWMLHASAVADDDGRVIVLIGPSGRGKTTAVRALAQHYAYVTDETVAIDSSGRVHAYRKPLSIIEEVGAAKAQRSPGELGLGELPAAPLQMAALVLLERRIDGPDDALLESCDLGDVLRELAEQSSHLTGLPHPLQTIAAHVSAVGGIQRVIYREAASLAAALAPLFRASGPTPVATTGEKVAANRDAGAGSPESEGWHRTPYLDALALDDSSRVAVLRAGSDGRGMLRILSGIGPVLWANADGRSPHDLVSAAVSAHGEPGAEDPARLVSTALVELAAQGLLHQRDDASPKSSGT